MNIRSFLLGVIGIGLLGFGWSEPSAATTLSPPTLANVAAGSATLILQADTTGTGYFTLLTGTDTPCGSGAQVAAGLDGNGNPAYRFGSLPLVADIPGNYTVSNILADTAYTVCFTADDGTTLYTEYASTNLSTPPSYLISNSIWDVVGNPGFSTSSPNFTKLAFAPNGIPYVAYSFIGTTTVMKFENDTWSVVGNQFSNVDHFSMSFAFAPNGTPYLGYRESETGRAIVRRFENGSWAVLGEPDSPLGVALDISLAFAPDGSPYVAYRDIDNGSKATLMKYENGLWSAVGNRGFTGSKTQFVSLAIAPDGTPFVAFQDIENSYRFWATVMKYDNGVWSVVGDLNASHQTAINISLAISPDGTPFIAYGNYQQEVKVQRYNNGIWSVVDDPFFAAYYDYLEFAISPDGKPYVALGNEVMGFENDAWVVIGGVITIITLLFLHSLFHQMAHHMWLLKIVNMAVTLR